jgi:hypothetical protein
MTNESCKATIQKLRAALHGVQQGKIENTEAGSVIALLAECWNLLEGASEESMSELKLHRAEQLSWNPPVLSFTMERHGATVLGSKRAELQNWAVNLDTGTADCTEGGYRQLIRATPELDVTSIVARVCEAVQEGPGQCALVKEGILVWHGEQQVEIKHGRLIPDIGFQQTVAGRRRRFRQKLTDGLSELGWQLRSVRRSMIFQRIDSNWTLDRR